MNTNQKSIAVLSSPYLFGISQVGRKMAVLARHRYSTVRTALSTLAIQRKDLAGQPIPGDGQRSTHRCHHGFCSDVIPANRTNRKDRRAATKFARRNPTIKAS